MTTLRELIITRPEERKQLLQLLTEFSYFERSDIKEHVNFCGKDKFLNLVR